MPSRPWRTPKEQPPPESLRHKGPRAPDSLESVRRAKACRAAEGAKLSGARDRRGRQPERSQGRRRSHPFPERSNEQGSPQRPDRRDAGPGTPYSGDPQAARAQPELDKLPLDSLAPRARWRGWSRSPATKCRSSMKGSSPSICGPARMPGLFDVSHMGQLLVHGRGVDEALEKLMPGDFQAAADMKPKYSLLLDEDGGIIDDLMATRRGDDFYVVVNGATKHGDIADMERRLPRGDRDRPYEGAGAARAAGAARCRSAGDDRSRASPSSASCRRGAFHWQGQPCGSAVRATPARTASRFRFRRSQPPTRRRDRGQRAGQADRPWRARFAAARGRAAALRPRPRPPNDAGDGRPHLRDQQAPARRRRVRRRACGSSPSSRTDRIQKRVGFDVDGRQPVREGALVLDGEGNEVGKITSGGFSPSLQRPIAMGYVATALGRARHRAEARAARQIVRRARRRRCRSSRTAITAREPAA